MGILQNYYSTTSLSSLKIIIIKQIRKIFKTINLSHLEPKLEIGITGRNNVFKIFYTNEN
jgi:hypothetical protein